MIEAHWILFVVASVVLIATPGQDMILVMSRSITHGTRAGVAAAAGVSVGLVGHTALATLGLGALLRASEWLFVALKFAGAAYLVYLGAQLVFTRTATLASNGADGRSAWRHFTDGAASNLGNPKIAIFYFAFLPQFVHPAASHPTTTLFALGVAFAALTFAVKGPVGWSAGMLSAWLRANPQVLVWLHRVSGGVLLGLGLRLAFERRQ